eukprot:TRINITY_DN1577_c0_g2_i3.p1 TRINITY_DN1577_c0_g2~~TRINITY_DN1577_c0_g2_i3.p1  ORF type:complete len:186 (-),score=39.57 TRINITY_DN1577_c0_g2_i3:52-609(-)
MSFQERLASLKPLLDEFVSLPVIFAYCIIPPFIDMSTEKNDIDCSFHANAVYLHSVLYALTILVGFLYFLKFDQSVFRAASDQFFRTRFPDRPWFSLFCYMFLRLAVLTFWSLFLNPEPLSCWIEITNDEYAGFQPGRVAIVGGSGLVLFAMMWFIDKHSGVESSDVRAQPLTKENASSSSYQTI